MDEKGEDINKKNLTLCLPILFHSVYRFAKKLSRLHLALSSLVSMCWVSVCVCELQQARALAQAQQVQQAQAQAQLAGQVRPP